MAGEAGAAGGLHVTRLVADQKALLHAHWPMRDQVLHHPGTGLAPIRLAPVLANSTLGMKRTIAERIDVSAALPQLLVDPAVQLAHVVLGIVPAPDAGLVSHDKDEEAAIIEPFDRFPCAVDPFEMLRQMYIAVVDVEHPVAIEKRRAARRPVREARLRPRKIFRQSDID